MVRQFHFLLAAASGCAIGWCVPAGLAGEAISIQYDTPTLDRWNYPFNQTPGTRPNASIFGAFVGEELSDDFDNRDAQFHVAFDTSGDIEPHQGTGAYVITQARITVMVSNNNVFVYDPTPDPWQSYLPSNDPDFVPDTTPGRPMEIYGVGFRNGFDALSYQETTAYSPFGPFGQDHRTTYALDFGDDGQPRDVSNNIRDAFEVYPFAIGTTETVAPGQSVPVNTVFTFDLDVDDPYVQTYLQEALDLGRLHLMIASLHPASEAQDGSFPEYYTKENLLVLAGLADAPGLTLVVEPADAPGIPGDLNGDGVVDVFDLLILLSAWGACADPDECPADLNGDGVVDVFDLLILLNHWG